MEEEWIEGYVAAMTEVFRFLLPNRKDVAQEFADVIGLSNELRVICGLKEGE